MRIHIGGYRLKIYMYYVNAHCHVAVEQLAF